MPRRKSSLPALGVVTDPVESAKAVGLRYVSDQALGIKRLKSGTGFRYLGPGGTVMSDQEHLRRIKSLAIPPAWTDVWICPLPDGHLQATGRDDRGRKQYRYHHRWREVRDETKYNRMIEFAKMLPQIRQQVDKDLGRPDLPKEKVLATVVRLLEVSLIRVGNEEYAKNNGSFGLTTMRDKHVTVSGSTLNFHFRGKSGKHHVVKVDDRRLARIVQKCQDLPGQELFQYLDAKDERQSIGSADVNEYLKGITGTEFTAKDFRTWAGTVLAARALQELERVDSQVKAKKNILRAVEAVSQMLGNTPSICRKCYVHPAVFESYLDGALIKTLRRRADDKMASSLNRLRPEEAAVLGLLERRLFTEEQRGKGWMSHSRRSSLRNVAKAQMHSSRAKAALRRAIPASWRT
jgi:DNA topoisomerase-1